MVHDRVLTLAGASVFSPTFVILPLHPFLVLYFVAFLFFFFVIVSFFPFLLVLLLLFVIYSDKFEYTHVV